MCWLITVTRISPVATQFWAPPSNLSTVILFINRTKSGASTPDNTDHLEVRIQDLQKSTIVQQVILELLAGSALSHQRVAQDASGHTRCIRLSHSHLRGVFSRLTRLPASRTCPPKLLSPASNPRHTSHRNLCSTCSGAVHHSSSHTCCNSCRKTIYAALGPQ